MPVKESGKRTKWWKNLLQDRSRAPSPAPSSTQSIVKVQPPEQGDVEHGTKASNNATKPHAPSKPSAADVETTRASTDVRGKEPHHPAAASTIEKTPKSPSSDDAQSHVVPSIEPRAEDSRRATEPTLQQSPALSISQRVWNAAYDNLAKGNAKLIGSYVRTLAHVLETEASEMSRWQADDIAAELKDPSKRQKYLKKLVVEGQVKVAKESKIMEVVGSVADAILVLKPTVDMLIENIPQAAPAALPWGGVCAGLQILSSAGGVTPANLTGIAHVISRMDWYCTLTEHALNKEKSEMGNESFDPDLDQLEEVIIKLYEALLLYQMRSVCFYYRKRGLVFLSALLSLDDWKGDLKDVTDAEAAFMTYSNQYYNEYYKSALYQLVGSDKKREGLLGEIRQDIRQLISAQEKNRSDNTTSACLRALDVVDPHDHIAIIKEKEDELLEDTYKWILDTQEYAAFTNWNNNGPGHESSRLLWIKGDAGTGKTMLMIGIISKLSPQTVFQTPKLSFFFCQGGDPRRNGATVVLKSLIWLLLIQQPHLISHFRQKYEVLGANLLQGDTAFHTLHSVFQDMLKDPDLSPVYLAVDALDECEVKQSNLIKLISTSFTLTKNVKWLVSSRPSVKIENPQLTLLKLDARSLEHPVKAYISHKLLALKGYSKDQLAELKTEIGQRAMNTFLWVALVFKELHGRGGNDAVRIVKKIPPGLSEVYNHILSKIRLENEDDESRCKNALAAISLAYRPLSLLELAVLADLEPGVIPESIIEKCGSFLITKENTVHLIHQSARDYLKENFESKLQKGGVVQGHADMCRRSIWSMSNLEKNIYALPDYGFKTKGLRPPDNDPLDPIRYSCLFWVDHLCDANSQSLDFKKKLADDKKTWELFNSNLCNNQGHRLRLEKELIDNGTTWKFFNDHLANHQGLDKQLAYGGAVWTFFNDHLRDANGRGLKFKEQLATGKTVWKFFNNHLVNHQSPDFKDMVADGGVVETFFNDHFLHWLESLSLLGELSASVRSIRKLFTQLQLDLSPKLVRFLNDAEKFVLSHGSIIEQAPLQTYGSALVFSPTISEVKKEQWKERLSFIDMVAGIRDNWGAHQQTLEGHSGWVNTVVFSPDGKTVASASNDKTVRLWNATTGAHQQTLEGHSNWVNIVVFSPDGKTVVSASDDKTVRLWNATTGAYQQTLEGHSGRVNTVVFSPDSKTVASASDDKTVRLWNVVTGAHQQTLEGHSSWVNIVVFSPDGKTVASASYDKTVRLWNVTTSAYQQMLEGHSSWVNTVVFSPDGKTVASASDDKTVRLWNATTGVHQQTLEGHSSQVNTVVFSPDGKTVASASNDKTVRLWNATTGVHQQTLEGHSSWVNTVVFSPDGKTVASASDDETVRLWNATTGVHQQMLEGHSDRVNTVVFSPDSKTVASASDDETVRLWNATTGAHQQMLEGHSDRVNTVVFSPDSKTVASVSDDKTVRLWNATTGAYQQTLEGHSNWVNIVVFSPDGKTVASASDDKTVRLWNVTTGVHQQTLEGHSGRVNTVVFSPDGKTVASASNDKTVRLWNATTGAHQQTLEGHSDWVNTVVFSPDGKTVASASDDETVRLWNATTGAHQQTLEVGKTLYNLRFNTTGSYLKTGIGKILIPQSPISNPTPIQTLPQTPQYTGYGISSDRVWITWNSKNLLWLPLDSRPVCSDVAQSASTVTIGCRTGQVLIFRFSPNESLGPETKVGADSEGSLTGTL